MTITLTQKENSELWAEAEMNSLQNSDPDEFICQVPRQLGKGYMREIEVHLGPIFADQGGLHYSPRLKPATIARIDYAREILLSRLENPPSIVELAQLVGVSTTTLKRGFTELFGTTVFRYITDKRMEWAEQLLRQGNTSVAEIANKIGYSNPGHFAAAFKCRFGITPSQCLMGKKVLLGS